MRRWLCSVVVTACLAAPVWAGDCIDVQLRAEKIAADPLARLQLFYHLHNCGDAGLAALTSSLAKDGQLVGEIETSRFLHADERVQVELLLPIPPAVPAGLYRLCAGARLGQASDSECALVVLDGVGNVLSFTAKTPVPVASVSWAVVKQVYRR